MKKIKEAVKVITAGLVLPWSALAAGTSSALYTRIVDVVNAIIYIIFILMTVYFIWGVFQLVSAGGDEKKVAAGKQHMIWGILGIVVAAALWGIVNLVSGFLGVSGESMPQFPRF